MEDIDKLMNAIWQIIDIKNGFKIYSQLENVKSSGDFHSLAHDVIHAVSKFETYTKRVGKIHNGAISRCSICSTIIRDDEFVCKTCHSVL